jgi:hypothetical protein
LVAGYGFALGACRGVELGALFLLSLTQLRGQRGTAHFMGVAVAFYQVTHERLVDDLFLFSCHHARSPSLLRGA